MGLGGFLKKWGPMIAGVGLMPFTGGASALLAKGSLAGKIASIAGAAAPILGKMSASQAAGNRVDTQNDMYRDRLNLDRFRTNQRLPDQRLTSSMRAGAVSRMRPVKSEWGGQGSWRNPGGGFKITGGYNDDLIAPETRRQADDVVHDMLQAQLRGDEAPELSSPRGGGAGEKILGGAAAGMSIIDGINKTRNRDQPTHNHATPGNADLQGPDDIHGRERMSQVFDDRYLDDEEEY